MATDERARYALHTQLRRVLGEDEATTLMSGLAPIAWNELATHADLDTLGIALRGEMAELRHELRGEMAELRTELRGEMAELRGEMAELRTELRGEMAELRGELRGEMGELRGEMGELRGELCREMAANTRTVVFAMIGTNATLVALAFAAARLA